MTSNEIQKQVDNIVINTYKKVEKQLDTALDRCSRAIIQTGKQTPFTISGSLEKQVDKIFNEFSTSSYEAIKNGIGKSWELSNETYDKLLKNSYALKKYIANKIMPGPLKDAMFNHNKTALESFINRGLKGAKISDRVWKVQEVAKNELGLLMQEGLAVGKSASELSRDVRQILKEPNKLFRRVKDADGKLQLSKSARNYHPGQGVYRSSYQNALRLTGSEVNIAYETAQYTRHQKLDFVTGFEVKLSNNHPEEDICDHLKGKYPKTFKFNKWHPRCRCHSEPLLLNEDEFFNFLDKGEIPQSKIVKNIPQRASDYVANNKKVFNALKSKPYFLTDNKQYFERVKQAIVKPKQSIPQVKVDKKLTGLNIDEAKKAMQDFNFSQAQKDAVDAYTQRHFIPINGYLRGVRKEILAVDEITSKNLSELIAKAPKVEATSFRGITLEGRQFADFKTLKKGDIFTDKGFVSTTYDKNIAAQFSNTAQYQVEMTVKGKNGVLIENLSNSKAEKEIIFNKGSNFKIESMKIKEKAGIYGKIFVSLIEI